MNNLRNEKIRSVLLALLLAVSFLILDGGIQCGYQRYWLTGDASKVEAASPEREQNQDPRGTLSVQYEEVEQIWIQLSWKKSCFVPEWENAVYGLRRNDENQRTDYSGKCMYLV